jgi:hypothetical protein
VSGGSRECMYVIVWLCGYVVVVVDRVVDDGSGARH